ncbi:Rieske (2Fe-2S) protein [Croceicoccus mobilis]|uniref:Ferredoxin n=1 Tax=Croceicoccus mobilis TaxID=1703339 RepID=A0A917DYZ2_9SPHN|nr:Rieske (2Fe-2S) protein [Croceicoccus mobilis]GGD80348.1 ferredoxin [Croceicoccus mobilis]
MATIPLSQIPESGASIIEVEGKRVLVCRNGNAVLAMDETCPHQDLSLEGARVRRGSLFCPHHGARFSLEDGRSLSPMTDCPLKFYPVAVSGEEVEITL